MPRYYIIPTLAYNWSVETIADVNRRLQDRATELFEVTRHIADQKDLAVWHTKMITSLLQLTMQCINHVGCAVAKPEAREFNLGYLAWAVRSLYEIRLWIRLSRNKKNLDRFIHGLLLDGLDVFEGFKDVVEQNLSDTPFAGQFDMLRSTLEQMLEQASLTKKGLKFNIQEESAKLGLEKEYGMFKFLSKLAHPTAVSVALTFNKQIADGSALMVLYSADDYVVDIISTVSRFIPNQDSATVQN